MPTKVKGCRNCSRRRINCDQTQPRCKKCVRDNLECYGLSGTYRWVAAPTARRTRRHAQPKHASESQVPEIESSHAGDTVPTVMSVFSPTERLSDGHPDQWVTNYFAEQITPWMCPVLRSDNECKMYLLPLAASSQLVFDAVAATSFHRLSYYGNAEFAAKAERYKASAIQGLMRSCRNVCSASGSSEDQLFAAAGLLILMYDEMIAAQDYFTTLARIIESMRHFVDFSALGGSSELHRYLADQFGILTMFSLPHVDNDVAMKLQTPALHFVENFASTTVTDDHNLPFLAYCWKTMLTIWFNQKQNSHFDVCSVLEEFRFRIESKSDIMEIDHYMTWVYFMAAAASPTPSLREFFMNRLYMHTITFGWKNVAMMHSFLKELENFGPEWPSRLQSHKSYICA